MPRAAGLGPSVASPVVAVTSESGSRGPLRRPRLAVCTRFGPGVGPARCRRRRVERRLRATGASSLQTPRPPGLPPPPRGPPSPAAPLLPLPEPRRVPASLGAAATARTKEDPAAAAAPPPPPPAPATRSRPPAAETLRCPEASAPPRRRSARAGFLHSCPRRVSDGGRPTARAGGSGVGGGVGGSRMSSPGRGGPLRTRWGSTKDGGGGPNTPQEQCPACGLAGSGLRAWVLAAAAGGRRCCETQKRWRPDPPAGPPAPLLRGEELFGLEGRRRREPGPACRRSA